MLAASSDAAVAWRRRDVDVPRDPPHCVVASREERRADQGEDDSERTEAGRTPRIEREHRATRDDQRGSRQQRRTEWLVEERQRQEDGAEGAVPTRIDAREGPA